MQNLRRLSLPGLRKVRRTDVWCRPGRFYRNVLGLRVADESENYDTEQEHLNNVFAARLRITSLRASSGPVSSCLSISLREMGVRCL